MEKGLKSRRFCATMDWIYDYLSKGDSTVLNRKTVLMIAMGFALSACASSAELFPEGSDHMALPPPEVSANDSVMISKDIAPKTKLSYDGVVEKYSNDSIQLFSLGDVEETVSTPAGEFKPAMAIKAMPKSTSADSSVTVFSLDDPAPTPVPAAKAEIVADAPASDGNTIYFDHGSAAINADGKAVVAEAAKAKGKIAVEGHASQRAQSDDPKERGLINLQMSMKRAMAVSKQLVAEGATPENIKTTAHGDAALAEPETTPSAEAKNRRVEILTGAE